MKEKTQHKTSISRIIQSKQSNHTSTGFVDNRTNKCSYNRVNMCAGHITPSNKDVLQKKEPVSFDMPADVVLSHGSNSPAFYLDKKAKTRKPRQVPNGPAWFGAKDDFISILTTIRYAKSNTKNVEDSTTFPIYYYKMQENENMMLAKWETWKEALEDILWRSERKLYQDISRGDNREPIIVEPKLPASGTDRGDLGSEQLYGSLKDKDLHWQTKTAANKIFQDRPAIHGYYLEQDPIITGSPEYVLNDDAMKKLGPSALSKRGIEMKKIAAAQAAQYEIEYNGKKIYWKEGVKDHLSKDKKDNDRITDNTMLSNFILAPSPVPADL